MTHPGIHPSGPDSAPLRSAGVRGFGLPFQISASCLALGLAYTATNPAPAPPSLADSTASSRVASAQAPGQARLAYWRFNQGDWNTESGAAPWETAGLESVGGIDGEGLRLNRRPAPARLRFRETEADGALNLDFRQGTVRFLYRPDWGTTNGGPGELATLFQAGARGEDGSWALRVPSAGSRLQFVQQLEGKEQLVADGSIAFARGAWYALTLAYGPAGCSLWVNGTSTLGPGAARHPLRSVPPAPVRAQGFWIGSDSTGQSQAQGTFDEFEIFNYPLAAPVIRQDLETGLTATVSASPPRVTLCWRNLPSRPMEIRRRSTDQASGSLLASNCTTWSFVDTDVTAGAHYEYALRFPREISASIYDRYVFCPVEAPPRHDRATVLLLVDETVARALGRELAQFKFDLVGDGWKVVQRDAPRHDDSRWPNNTNRIARLKTQIDQVAATTPDLRAIFLLGHVVIPHSGSCFPDGHQTRPFPVDLYYGDLRQRSNDWPDLINYIGRTNPAPPFHPPVPNVPRDGIFDPMLLPSAIEIPVGRVDFAGLPILTAKPPAGVNPVSEVELLRRYLRKNHRYRHGTLRFPDRIAAFNVPLGPAHGETSIRLALRNGSSWFRPEPSYLFYGDIFRSPETNGFLWGFEFGSGGYTSIANSDPRHIWTSADTADPAKEALIGFYFLDGSFFGDWNADRHYKVNNLLRCLLAQPNSGLAALWCRNHNGDVSLQSLAAGDTLGDAWTRFLNSVDWRDHEYPVNVHFSLLGDPTLRQHILRPPSELTGETEAETVRLRWNPSPDAHTRYHVYRSTTGLNGPLVLLTSNAISDTTFVDRSPPRGRKTYAVRATALTVTGSGSFHNLSQATFHTPR